MKRANYLLIVLLLNSPFLFGQGVYFKASSNYNISTTNQEMPEYFTYRIGIRGNEYYRYINFKVNEFSLASGQNYQGAVGYSFNDFLSFELKYSTFNKAEKVFEAYPKLNNTLNGITEWDLSYYSLLPTVLFGHSFKKTSINVYVYSGFGISKLNIKASMDNLNYRAYELDGNKSFSWGYGLEYSYSLAKHFSLFTTIGINTTNYKPDKAQLTSTSAPMEYLDTSEKEIRYVDQITNLELGYNGSIDPDSPEIRLKEILRLNSIYGGIGIKYTLKK